MKAYVYGANGAEITDVAKPTPKGTQVLVKVHACGLNRADLGMTKGHVHGSAGGVVWVDAHGDINTPATSPSDAAMIRRRFRTFVCGSETWGWAGWSFIRSTSLLRPIASCHEQQDVGRAVFRPASRHHGGDQYVH